MLLSYLQLWMKYRLLVFSVTQAHNRNSLHISSENPQHSEKYVHSSLLHWGYMPEQLFPLAVSALGGCRFVFCRCDCHDIFIPLLSGATLQNSYPCYYKDTLFSRFKNESTGFSFYFIKNLWILSSISLSCWNLCPDNVLHNFQTPKVDCLAMHDWSLGGRG